MQGGGLVWTSDGSRLQAASRLPQAGWPGLRGRRQLALQGPQGGRSQDQRMGRMR